MGRVPDSQELERERELLARATKGDTAALRALLREVTPALHRAVILPRAHDEAEAEVVLRDTLATAALALDRYEDRGLGIFPWLRQIATRKLADAHRTRRRQDRLRAAATVELGDARAEPADSRLLADEERRLKRALIDEVLTSLSPRYQQAIALRLVKEMPREACADAMQVTLGNFDVILHRAVTAFRKLYRDEP